MVFKKLFSSSNSLTSFDASMLLTSDMPTSLCSNCLNKVANSGSFVISFNNLGNFVESIFSPNKVNSPLLISSNNSAVFSLPSF